MQTTTAIRGQFDILSRASALTDSDSRPTELNELEVAMAGPAGFALLSLSSILVVQVSFSSRLYSLALQ